jgi:Glycosyl transferases group 1
MVLFLYTFSINRARTSSMFYEELIRCSDRKSLLVLDIAKHSIAVIGQYIDKADLLVFDNSIMLSMGKASILSRNFYTSKGKIKEFYIDVWDLVNRADKPVFLLHPSSDLHAVNFGLERELYLEVLKKITGIFWPYHQCPVERTDENDRYPFTTLEPFKITKEEVINIWDEVNEHVPISIDFPHCLGQTELDKRPRKKVWDVIVPGVSYKTRQLAQDSAVQAGLFVAPYVGYSRWLILAPYLLYNKVIQKKYSSPAYQKKSFRLYRYMISLSSTSFTCGSELKFFVRKFLEVPAFRSAMLTYPSNNFRDYGFEDGVHYLHTYPEEAGEKARYLLNNKSFADKLVKNAWELVARQHTASERVNQVLSCIHFFLQGKLKSAGYAGGKFEIAV